MAELNEMLGSILQDEKSMEMIQSALQGLTGTPPQQNEEKSDDEEKIQAVLSALKASKGKEDDRCRLLSALRPFLGAARREKLDKSIGLLRALTVMEAMGGNFFV